ncbi:DUF397 domain-containing protein [Pseudonocardiaceae bacterium YIM PH 21723]|nr:DUF397 domain-containing protein [Pseudonocardiaceae bacterium YIM PH 21723]
MHCGLPVREVLQLLGEATAGLKGLSWRKSRYSGKIGNCVEVAKMDSGEIAMRNSRFPEGSVVVYTRDEMAAFLAGAKDGEFDYVLG